MKSVLQLKIEDLTVGYGKGKRSKPILSDLNITTQSGSLIALVGSNGKGKSTLLKTIAGLLNPLHGTIYIDNKELSSIDRISRARLISYVGTSHEINKNLKVRDLVALGRYPYSNIWGQLSDSDIKIITRAMVDTKTLHLRDSAIGEISDGERQRALIARSLAQNTPIILLDEPTAFLDVANKFEMVDLMRQLSRQRNKIIIFSSHDLPTILGNADYMWLIFQRSIIDAIPEELVMTRFLDTIFENSKVVFDLEHNEFKIDFKPSKYVKLTGEKYLCKWTEKALLRYGIGSNSESGKIEINIKTVRESLFWEIWDGLETHTFDTLKDLLTYITSDDQCVY